MSNFSTALQFISKVQHRLPTTAKAAYFIALVGVAVIIGGCTPENVESYVDTTPSIESSYVQEEVSPTATFTATQTQTVTSTPTKYLTQTPTPIIKGDMSVFTENMEEGGVLDRVLQVQNIVNSYKPEYGNFSVYIKEARENCKQAKLEIFLDELSKVEELNDMTFLEVLKNSISEYSIPNFSPWPESMYDVLTDSEYNILSNPQKFPVTIGSVTGEMISEKENILSLFGEMSNDLQLIGPSDVIVNTDTFDSSKTTGLSPYLILDMKIISGETYFLVTRLNENGKIELLSIPWSQSKEYFGYGRWLFWKG